ncbi:MAG: hypothetical protein ABJB66_10120 [Gemmatimonadaceae bacterium]
MVKHAATIALAICSIQLEHQVINTGASEAHIKPSAMYKLLATITLGIALPACAPLPPSAVQSPPTAYVAATRSAADCMPLSHGAAADSYAESRLHLQLGDENYPISKRVFLPDVRIRATAVEKETATLFIRFDERGIAMRDSVRVTGIPNGARMQNLIEVGRKTEVWPLVREGCAVPTWAQLFYGGKITTKN